MAGFVDELKSPQVSNEMEIEQDIPQERVQSLELVQNEMQIEVLIDDVSNNGDGGAPFYFEDDDESESQLKEEDAFDYE